MAAVNLQEIGRVGLGGWKGKLGNRVATPVAKRTPLSEEQVEAAIGLLFLALTIVQFVKLMRRVVAAGRS